MARYVEDGPEGDWFAFTLAGGVRQQCCSCGLVHEIEFRRKGGKLQMRFMRNERATGAARRSRKRKVVIVDE